MSKEELLIEAIRHECDYDYSAEPSVHRLLRKIALRWELLLEHNVKEEETSHNDAMEQAQGSLGQD